MAHRSIALALAARLTAPEADPLETAAELETQGRYEDASEVLARAYERSPDPLLLVGRAELERRGISCTTAVELYRAFLDSPEKADEVGVRGSSRKMIEDCKRATTLESEGDRLRNAGVLEQAAERYAEAFRVTASRPLHRKRIEVDVALRRCESAATILDGLDARSPEDDSMAALRRAVATCGTVPPPAAAIDPTPPAEDVAPKPTRNRDGLGLGLVIGGSALTVAGAVLVGSAYRLRSDATGGDVGLQQFRNDQTRARGFQGAGAACLGVGLAAVTVGIVHIVRHRRKQAS